MIYIIGNLEFGRNLVNKWQPSELPMVASHIPELINKVKINPEMCCKNRKQYDKSYKNFWYIYKSVITIIWLMSTFLGKQVKRLKCLGLQTTNSCSSNFHTLAKIGANSCQMMEKHLYKSYYKFRNGHSYLEWPILGIREYLQTTMLSWRHWRLTATPSGNVYKRQTGTRESQSGPDHSHSMVSVPLLSLTLLNCPCLHLFRLRCFTIGLSIILYWLFALNLIWLYICWHKNVRIPLYLYKKHYSLRTILAKLNLLSLSPSLSLSLSDSNSGIVTSYLTS